MRFGGNGFASIGFGDSDLDFSSIPASVDLIADQEAARAYLFHATPYDPVSTAETDVRASIGLKRPILDSLHWPAYLKSACDSQVDLFGEDEGAQGRASFGNIELLIGDGEHDEIASYFWDGRDVEVKLGAEGFGIDEYVTILKGTADDITYDRRRLSVVFRGKEEMLNEPVQKNLYAGTGGLEGGEDLEGSEKPLSFGPVQNITPVAVDRDNLIYQVHDGPILQMGRVLDGGVRLGNLGDVADIEATTVAPGYFKTQISGGYFRLGAPTEKQLTCNLFGDNTGGYVERAADIIERLALNYSDLTADDINWPSFYTANLDSNRAICGMHIRNETLIDAITELMQSIGGAWSFNRLGLLTLAVMRKRRSAGTITDNDIVTDSFQRVRTIAPSWQRRIGYAKNSTVQTEDQFLGAATDAQKNFSMKEYSYVSSEDATIKTRRKSARVVEKPTLITYRDDAATMLARQQLVYGNDFDRINITARRQQFKYQVGETITLQYDRFGISKDMVILGIRENTSTRQTVLRLWG
jgi:hypothetical protein